MMRFDRFTERAQEAAQRAAEIIQRYGHNQIDTEHILLALIEQPQGVIPQILEYLKVDANALTERLDYILRTSPKANIFGWWRRANIYYPASNGSLTWQMRKLTVSRTNISPRSTSSWPSSMSAAPRQPVCWKALVLRVSVSTKPYSRSVVGSALPTHRPKPATAPWRSTHGPHPDGTRRQA